MEKIVGEFEEKNGCDSRLSQLLDEIPDINQDELLTHLNTFKMFFLQKGEPADLCVDEMIRFVTSTTAIAEEKSETPRVLNRYTMSKTETGVNVMRGTEWGNKYIIGKDGDRNLVVAKHRRDIMKDKESHGRIREKLKGKNLICCCAPLRCHALVLLQIANSSDIVK